MAGIIDLTSALVGKSRHKITEKETSIREKRSKKKLKKRVNKAIAWYYRARKRNKKHIKQRPNLGSVVNGKKNV